MSVSDQGISGEREFPTTSWSFLRQAQDASAVDHARQMNRLAEIYWRPVYSFIRQTWSKGHDEGKDLTQEFFATVVFERHLIRDIERQGGGFRAFLRTAIRHFMVDVQRASERQKRGGGQTILSLDDVDFRPLGDAGSSTAEETFDSAWNEAVMTEALQRLERRLVSDGRGGAFEAFRRYDVEGGSAEMSYAEMGRHLAMTERQVRHAVTLARGAFREVVTEIISAYVDDPAELAAELKALFGV